MKGFLRIFIDSKDKNTEEILIIIEIQLALSKNLEKRMELAFYNFKI